MNYSKQKCPKMAAVKPSGSSLELILQKALWKVGARYRKNYKGALGTPDIAFPRLRIAVFCDSEFWHGYNWKHRKWDFKTNHAFWWRKIEDNIARDKKVNAHLRKAGWIVLRFWGQDILNRLDQCVETVLTAIKSRSDSARSLQR